MKFDLTEEQYKYISETVVHPLEQAGARVWCFGSRARGNNQKFSDLDLMIESSNDLTILISQIKETLTNSHLPFKVDIVPLSEFAASYLPIFEKEKKSWV
ncbi:MAG: nucleotidyltransferase domain-containing protein [Bdellovibrionales bacterium]|nr:nucleotidyltransferase domain-containing protein [Bdellovibrionales bacterium]